MAASGARVSLALLSGVALQAAALSIEDLEEEHGDAVLLKVDREGAPRTADPRIMKILSVGTASISALVAGALQSACCSQSLRGPLSGITSEKNRGKRIQELGGIGAHNMNSREESMA